jgi:hypothetical protein
MKTVFWQSGCVSGRIIGPKLAVPKFGFGGGPKPIVLKPTF